MRTLFVMIQRKKVRAAAAETITITTIVVKTKIFFAVVVDAYLMQNLDLANYFNSNMHTMTIVLI